MSSTQPLISVILPVYNAAPYLRLSIESILNQTYSNFELLILDDHSTDGSSKIIEDYQDSRIRVIRHTTNLGLIACLNKGLEQAKGTYIARMDADDISLPHRFTTQLAFMEAHPAVGVCGSWVKYIGQNKGTVMQYPTQHDQILTHFFFNKATFCHPSVFLRNALLQKQQLTYPTKFPHAEDFAFWITLHHHCRLANIPQVLLQYRQHSQQVSLRHQATQRHWFIHTAQKFIQDYIPDITPNELDTHFNLFPFQAKVSIENLKEAHQWLLRLYHIDTPSFLCTPYVQQLLLQSWVNICQQSTPKGLNTLKLFVCSPLSKKYPIGFKNTLIFVLDCLLKRNSKYLKE